jgi:hypothetical protein
MKAAAPVGPKGTFSAADWEEIKRSFAGIGVDLNTAGISAHFESGAVPHKGGRVYRYSTSNHPWLSAGPEWRLRDVLQQLAYFYTVPDPPTAKQWARELERAQAATEAALTALRFVAGAPANYPDNAMRPADATKDRALSDLMAWKIAELRERVAKLRAIDSRSQSALKTQTKYWHELTDLWRACRDGSRLHEKTLHRFLLACSRAPFAEISDCELGRRIDSFRSNLSRSKKRRS